MSCSWSWLWFLSWGPAFVSAWIKRSPARTPHLLEEEQQSATASCQNHLPWTMQEENVGDARGSSAQSRDTPVHRSVVRCFALWSASGSTGSIQSATAGVARESHGGCQNLESDFQGPMLHCRMQWLRWATLKCRGPLIYSEEVISSRMQDVKNSRSFWMTPFSTVNIGLQSASCSAVRGAKRSGYRQAGSLLGHNRCGTPII